MLGFAWAHIPQKVVSNLEWQHSYNSLESELVLPSASTLSNTCRGEYTLTLDAIKKQWPSRIEVSLALDRWTSTGKLAITSFIAYNMDWNWALREVELAFNEFDSSFFSYFEISSRITCQGSTNGCMASRTFEGSSGLFWAGWWLLIWNYNR